ncbi:MAG: YggS family pyridoxal phosphate-dependent enzyme [Candidatus Heimdallarchaeota archaeon]|nr:YggS family pyridoxal phosphate-dependent enzyme [Candidatus Heimdallarchaeota archaeon]
MTGKEHVQKIVKRYQKTLSVLSRYEKNGQRPELVLVTKNRPLELVMSVLKEIPKPILGENRVSEALAKMEKIDPNYATWHFIGHVQRNKVKRIGDKFSLIQSISNIPLADEIQKRAVKIDKPINCLLQIDICEDGTKFGFPAKKEYLKSVIQDLNSRSHLKIQGLMTIAPFVSPDETRPYFRRMRSIFDTLADTCEPLTNVEMKILSMGMSNDYIIALEEGSTMIRIGSAIFNDTNSNPKT